MTGDTPHLNNLKRGPRYVPPNAAEPRKGSSMHGKQVSNLKHIDMWIHSKSN